MPDEPDPPRKFYGFKPKSFENLNAPTGQIPATGKIDVRDHFRDASKSPAVPPEAPQPRRIPSPAPAPVPAANDVHALLRTNLERETAAGLHAVDPRPKRPSRRRRDYLALLLCINGLLIPLTFLSRNNPVVFVFSLSGCVILNVATTWIMWVVMDNY